MWKNDKKFAIACSKKWFFESKEFNFLRRNFKFLVINNKKKLNLDELKKKHIKIIFFPHWSYKVPSKIFNNFKCINFHTSPLPYGRGGSPIQNLILRKIKNAPVCALLMNGSLDGGPIYAKKIISLNGNLEDIFKRISNAIYKLILNILEKNLTPTEQKGPVKKFKRLNYKLNKLKKNLKFNDVYDSIRMLDHKEYRPSYLQLKNFSIHFRKVKKIKNKIICEAEIKKK